MVYLNLALALAFTTTATPAEEQWAAVAMHESDNGSRNATAVVGWATGAATQEEAVERAMEECVERGGTPDTREKDDSWGYYPPGFMCSVWAPHRLVFDVPGGGANYVMVTTACVALVKETNSRGIISFWSGHATYREDLRRAIAEFAASISGNVETLALVCSDDNRP